MDLITAFVIIVLAVCGATDATKDVARSCVSCTPCGPDSGRENNHVSE